MHNDANTFAGYESNAAAGQEDPGGDFNLAGAAGRAARTGSGAAADPTVPPLPEEEGQGEEEPEDPSTELLRSAASVDAWQDRFTIRLRTWGNVISPQFEAELAKMFRVRSGICRGSAASGQTTCSPRSVLTSRTRTRCQTCLAADQSAGLRDPESVAH